MDGDSEAIFSGENSAELWRRINDGSKRDVLYLLGCKCQELETVVQKQARSHDALRRREGEETMDGDSELTRKLVTQRPNMVFTPIDDAIALSRSHDALRRRVADHIAGAYPGAGPQPAPAAIPTLVRPESGTERSMWEAIHCLLLEVAPEIVHDVEKKVEAAFEEARTRTTPAATTAGEKCPRCEGTGRYRYHHSDEVPCSLCNRTGLMSEAVKKPGEHSEKAAGEWSEELPTKEGWYWHRASEEHGYFAKRVRPGTSGMGMITDWGYSQEFIQKIGGEWFGPIPQPGDPAATATATAEKEGET